MQGKVSSGWINIVATMIAGATLLLSASFFATHASPTQLVDLFGSTNTQIVSVG